MDFSIPDSVLQVATAFDTFCQERVAPRAAATDRAGELNRENWRDLSDIGFFKLYHDEAYGGSRADWLVRAMAEESLAKACAATFLSAGASVGLCGAPIRHHGSDALKAR
ncbi:MAG TPA: acyl-CoA dehydrogenase family protein, partial [Myxococcota bacterium]|nr:acyl-CoA dehydrogenase family protein [Myxococcota bacterium]